MVTSEDASLLLPGYDKTGWPLSVVVRVDVTKQGCLVRKAGQRTVRLTVAPGSWIVRTHLLFLLLFLRNTLIENPLDPTIRSRVPRVLFTTGMGKNVKRILFVAAVHRHDVGRLTLQNLFDVADRIEGWIGKDREGKIFFFFEGLSRKVAC